MPNTIFLNKMVRMIFKNTYISCSNNFAAGAFSIWSTATSQFCNNFFGLNPELKTKLEKFCKQFIFHEISHLIFFLIFFSFSSNKVKQIAIKWFRSQWRCCYKHLYFMNDFMRYRIPAIYRIKFHWHAMN